MRCFHIAHLPGKKTRKPITFGWKTISSTWTQGYLVSNWRKCFSLTDALQARQNQRVDIDSKTEHFQVQKTYIKEEVQFL